MLLFLKSNLATIIVLLIVGLLVFLAVYSIIKNKKSGKSPCGGSCEGCINSAYCNKQFKSKSDE